MFGESSKKWKGLSLATTLVALSAVVFAWNISMWNAPISLVVESIDLKVYWEQNCTTPVTAIDFGNIEVDGTSYMRNMWIRNEGLGPVTIYWNSTRTLVTDQIIDTWDYVNYYGWYPMNGTSISANQVFQTRYRIYVPSNVDPGSYSWTLYLGAEQ